MKISTIVAAAGLAFAALGASTSAGAQNWNGDRHGAATVTVRTETVRQDDVRRDRVIDRREYRGNDRRDHRGYDRRDYRGRQVGWDRGRHYGRDRHHRRCWTEWRHHHRIRVCR